MTVSTDETRRLLRRIADALGVSVSSFECSPVSAPVDMEAFVDAFARLEPQRQLAIATIVHELAGPPSPMPEPPAISIRER